MVSDTCTSTVSQQTTKKSHMVFDIYSTGGFNSHRTLWKHKPTSPHTVV